MNNKNNKSTTKEQAKKLPRNYLNNKDLLAAFMESKKQGAMSNRLAHMLQTLCARYAKKGNFASYTYNEDMQAYAMMMLVRTWESFNPEKSSNAFAFFTQCVKNSFIQYLNQEKRQRDVRDSLLLDNGMMPSYTYQIEHENNKDDGQDHHYIKENDTSDDD